MKNNNLVTILLLLAVLLVVFLAYQQGKTTCKSTQTTVFDTILRDSIIHELTTKTKYKYVYKDTGGFYKKYYDSVRNSITTIKVKEYDSTLLVFQSDYNDSTIDITHNYACTGLVVWDSCKYKLKPRKISIEIKPKFKPYVSYGGYVTNNSGGVMIGYNWQKTSAYLIGGFNSVGVGVVWHR